jgi:hypothetical protein
LLWQRAFRFGLDLFDFCTEVYADIRARLGKVQCVINGCSEILGRFATGLSNERSEIGYCLAVVLRLQKSIAGCFEPCARLIALLKR